MNRYGLELGVVAAVAMSATLITSGSAPRPGRPWAVTATPGNGSAAVVWRDPPATGTHIETYTVTASPSGKTVSVNGDRNSASVHGLRNGVSYTFTVHA